MIRILPMLLLVALLCSSCAHRAVTYTAPDATAMTAANRKLATAVSAAKAATATAAAAVSAAKQSHEMEVTRLAGIDSKVGDLALRVPDALKPEVVHLQNEIALFRSEQQATSGLVFTATTQASLAAQKAEEADKAKRDAEAKGAEYEASVAALAKKATDESAAYAKASKDLLWYRLHWWGAWIAAGLGVAVCALLAFLKFTGRLAIGAAKL